jgi:hypothetical protein
MRIYATFNGFKNKSDFPFKWINVNGDVGEKLKGLYFSENNEYFSNIKLKIGNRYRLQCKETQHTNILEINNVKQVNKNPRCNIFRRFKDEFHIIGGKYAGKKDKDIKNNELIRYCVWLAKESYNEATIENSLALLKKLNIND